MINKFIHYKEKLNNLCLQFWGFKGFKKRKKKTQKPTLSTLLV